MGVEQQLRVERIEWRSGLNNDKRYLLAEISSLSPEIIVRSFGRLGIELTICWMSLSSLACNKNYLKFST